MRTQTILDLIVTNCERPQLVRSSARALFEGRRIRGQIELLIIGENKARADAIQFQLEHLFREALLEVVVFVAKDLHTFFQRQALAVNRLSYDPRSNQFNRDGFHELDCTEDMSNLAFEDLLDVCVRLSSRCLSGGEDQLARRLNRVGSTLSIRRIRRQLMILSGAVSSMA